MLIMIERADVPPRAIVQGGTESMKLRGGTGRLVTAGAVTIALTASGVATASLAQAGTAGSWTQISSANLDIIQLPSVARLPAALNQQLLVTWPDTPESTGDRDSNLRSRLITPAGANGSKVKTVVAGWATVSVNSAPLVFGGKPAVAISGIRSTNDSSEVFNGTGALATSPTGASWSLRSTPITSSRSAYGHAFDAVSYQGKPLVAFTEGSTDHLTYSLDGADFQGTAIAGTIFYDVTLAKDPKTGAVWAAFGVFGNSTNRKNGIWVQRVKPSLTTPVRAPGSADSEGQSVVDFNTVALTTSSAGGVYLAYGKGYPSTTGVRVWKVGSSRVASTYHTFGTREARNISLTRGPAGRLWVSWEDSDHRLRAVRSNKARTAWGLRQLVKEPNRYGIWGTATQGSPGRLDIVALGTTSTGTHPLYHTQLKGGLTVKLSRASVKSSTGGTIVVTVKDAGTAVKGAKVVYRGTSHLTNAKGQVTLRVARKTSKGTKTVTVTRSGYTKAIKTFRVI
jgi:hypothetical protein